MAHEAKHHLNDSERKSYVDYVNKTFEDDESVKGMVAPFPIDGESSSQLFEVVSEGVLLCKLINKNFPSTIPEKSIVTKPEKNKFEKNINNELAIKAAKDLGCSVVNIGAEDLTSGTPTLVLGILWQIIKKSLLKGVNVLSSPDLRMLQTDETLETMTPEQVLLQWMNYHLKKAGQETSVKNFAGDIQDSLSYARLLHQIAPSMVSEEDVKSIQEESDLTRRAEKVIALAQTLLEGKSSLFVHPEDITDGNPRLNLAFTASLFNSYPALGASEQEKERLAQVESEVEKLKREKAELLQSFEAFKTESQQKSAEREKEFDQKMQEKETELENEKKSNEAKIQDMEEKILSVYKAEMDTKNAEIESQQKVNEEKLKEMEIKFAEEVKQKNQEIETVTQSREKEKADSEALLQKTREDFTAEIDRALELASMEKLNAVGDLQRSTDQEIERLKKLHAEELAALKAKYEAMLEALRKEHAEDRAALKEAMEAKILQLKETVQRLNDMLPERNLKEGFLIKQGGGRKTWKKRYFILKTNFVCYYKDQKNLKHPQGVIDLNDCVVRKVEEDVVKKRFVFEIATSGGAQRSYYCKANSEEEVEEWIQALNKAKAKFRSDAAVRQTFLNPADAPRISPEE